MLGEVYIKSVRLFEPLHPVAILCVSRYGSFGDTAEESPIGATDVTQVVCQGRADLVSYVGCNMSVLGILRVIVELCR